MPHAFADRNQQLYVEDIPVSEMAARFGTPLYLYAKSILLDLFDQYKAAFGNKDHRICYAVKANSNLTILKCFADVGAGFDIVSGGELARLLTIGADTKKIVFSGVGKSAAEIAQALDVEIGCFNVESFEELDRIDQIARTRGKVAPIAIRVNPNVDAKTHPYISTGLEENKFGLDMKAAESTYHRATSMPNIRIKGVSCHIGSALTDLSPFLDALDKLLTLVDRLADSGITLGHIDIGGGLGVRYHEENPPSIGNYVKALLDRMSNRPQILWCEPGRSLVADAGVLVTRVEYVKKTPKKTFAIVDAAMNDLIRPALYDAWHDIRSVDAAIADPQICDVVGPVCETGDCFARDRAVAVAPGALLAVFSAGAYGSAMASNYNSRLRPAEVLVDGSRSFLIRERETIDQMLSPERTALDN